MPVFWFSGSVPVGSGGLGGSATVVVGEVGLRGWGGWFDKLTTNEVGLTTNGGLREIFKVLGLLGIFWDIFWVG